MTLSDYVEEIVASGFPAMRPLVGRSRRFQLDSYLHNAVDRDVPEQGLAVRKPESMLKWLRAYAAATATTASYAQILDAATPGQADKPARSTSIAYRDVLTGLWLLDPVPAWAPSGSLLTRLGQTPKHHLADPAFAARLLGLSRDALLDGAGTSVGPQSGSMLGHLFESLVTLCVRVPAQAAEATVGHLRTRNGDHEVDLVVVLDDGRAWLSRSSWPTPSPTPIPSTFTGWPSAWATSCWTRSWSTPGRTPIGVPTGSVSSPSGSSDREPTLLPNR